MNLLPHHPQCAHWGSFPRWGKHKRGGAADGIDCPGFAFARPQLFPRILFFPVGVFFKAGEVIGNGIQEKIGDQQYACCNQ